MSGPVGLAELFGLHRGLLRNEGVLLRVFGHTPRSTQEYDPDSISLVVPNRPNGQFILAGAKRAVREDKPEGMPSDGPSATDHFGRSPEEGIAGRFQEWWARMTSEGATGAGPRP